MWFTKIDHTISNMSKIYKIKLVISIKLIKIMQIKNMYLHKIYFLIRTDYYYFVYNII